MTRKPPAEQTRPGCYEIPSDEIITLLWLRRELPKIQRAAQQAREKTHGQGRSE